MVDSLVREPINQRPGACPDLIDYGSNRNVIRQYHGAILDRLSISAPVQKKRIFLARGNRRRSYNQAELLSITKHHGFSAVYPEILIFRDQVQLLASAAFVIGPSAATFTNTSFSQLGTRLLSWLPPRHGKFCSYTNFASLTESRLRFLFTTPDQPLCSGFDAFRAGYHIDSNVFESALRLALESTEY
ncbi:glycosyltransferase family 61 protein [Cypionkella aquatica]|uniref:glycosyltransferase family 61 protein n=1 Tax=Cypionkella aquatica TaxID=1756042 RepID=UPI0024E1915E|nr:glycosyltransferase family 61 protein [Cypionkella aquatica]